MRLLNVFAAHLPCRVSSVAARRAASRCCCFETEGVPLASCTSFVTFVSFVFPPKAADADSYFSSSASFALTAAPQMS